VRSRAAAPSLNQSNEAEQGKRGQNSSLGRRNDSGRAGKGKATHFVHEENGEESLRGLSSETRKLIAEINKAFHQTNQSENGQDQQKKIQEKVQKKLGEHVQNGEEEPLSGFNWNDENEEEVIHRHYQRK